MARVKGGTTARTRRKKVLKDASGYFGSKHRLFKTAKEQLLHSGVYAYRDRRQKKRDFRKLWITRINAACRENEISYSKFINGLNKAGLMVNRKMLSELAIDNPKAFSDIVIIAKDALEGKEYKPTKVVLEKPTKKVPIKEESVKESTKKVASKKTPTKKVVETKKVVTPKKVVVKSDTKTKVVKKPSTKKVATKKVTTKKA